MLPKAEDRDADAIAAVPEDVIGDKDAFNAKMRQCNGYKTSFNRKNAAAIMAVKALQKDNSAYNRKYASEKIEAMETAYERLSDAYLQAYIIANGEAQASAQITDKSAELKGEYENVMGAFLNANIAPASAPAGPAAAAAAAAATGGQQQPFNNAIKPFTLSLETSPASYRAWKDEMQSYFEENNIYAKSANLQNSYYNKCLEPEIQGLIRPNLDRQVPAYNEPTGIHYLVEKVYQSRHTSNGNKLAYFRNKMKAGEKPLTYVAREQELYQDADLADLDLDERRTFHLLAGIPNKKLRDYILELKNPTYQEVVERIGEWSIDNTDSKLFEENFTQEAGKVNIVKTKNPGGRPKQKLPPVPGHIKNHPAALSGRCTICGATNHMREKCPLQDKAKCSKCDKKNHTSAVCMEEYNNWRRQVNKGGNGQKNAKGDTGNVREISASDEEDEEDVHAETQ